MRGASRTAAVAAAFVAVALSQVATNTNAAFHFQEQVGCGCKFPLTDEECTSITTWADCEAAAAALSLTFTSAFNISSSSYPGGCYLCVRLLAAVSVRAHLHHDSVHRACTALPAGSAGMLARAARTPIAPASTSQTTCALAKQR